jgi:hypothetical protein
MTIFAQLHVKTLALDYLYTLIKQRQKKRFGPVKQQLNKVSLDVILHH